MFDRCIFLSRTFSFEKYEWVPLKSTSFFIGNNQYIVIGFRLYVQELRILEWTAYDNKRGTMLQNSYLHNIMCARIIYIIRIIYISSSEFFLLFSDFLFRRNPTLITGRFPLRRPLSCLRFCEVPLFSNGIRNTLSESNHETDTTDRFENAALNNFIPISM